jgi:hypothetical protein
MVAARAGSAAAGAVSSTRTVLPILFLCAVLIM